MGWTYTHKGNETSIADFFKHEFQPNCYKILDIASTLNTAYMAVQLPEGTVYALVVLMQRDSKSWYNFGYKEMDEGMGPCEAQCPERILKLLTPTTNEHALAWRARCYAALDKKKHAAKAGDIIKFTEPLAFTDHSVHDTFTVMQRGKSIYFVPIGGTGAYRITNWKTRDYTIVEG